MIGSRPLVDQGCFIFPMSPFPALPQSTPPTNPPCRTPAKQMIFVRSKLRHRRKKVIFRQQCRLVFFVLLSLDDVGLLHRFPRFWNILKGPRFWCGSIVEQYQVEASHAWRVSWIFKRRCLRNGLHEGVKRCQGCCYQLVPHLTWKYSAGAALAFVLQLTLEEFK